MKNDSDRTQTHEVIEVIGSIFVNFANLKDFESRTVWEEALGARRLYGMNCTAHRVLHYESEIVQIGHEFMKLCRFSDTFSVNFINLKDVNRGMHLEGDIGAR